MGGKPTSPRAVAVAAAFALSCFCLILFAWVSFGGSVPLQAHGYRFHVLFSTAPDLAANEDVRIAGINVGKVTAVIPDGDNTEATLELDPQYAPLHTNARALLRSKTLLGENFIAITLGTPGSPVIRENGWLAPGQVDSNQAVDNFLSAFDHKTQTAFQQLFTELGEGLQGRGQDVNDAFGEWSPAFASLNQIIGIINNQQGQLQGLFSNSAQFLNAFAKNPDALQALFTAGNDVFGATAARNTDVTNTIDALPAFVKQLDVTLNTVKVTSELAAPTLKALTPVAPLFTPALEETNTLAPEITSAFGKLNTLIATTKADLPALTDIINAAQPLAVAFDPVLRQFIPFLQLFQSYDHEAVGFVANTGAALEATTTNSSGATVHYARAVVPINESIIFGQSALGPANRHNAYPAPGTLNEIVQGLDALDCANASNPKTPVSELGDTGAVPCVVAQGWDFQGVTKEFPNVEAYTP